MNFSKHLYAICGLGLVLTAISVGSNKSALRTPAAPPQSVMVANSSVPVTVNGASSIQVTNRKSEGPLLVRDVDVYARTLVQKMVSMTIEDPAFANSIVVYTVPAGKRLIVQTLSVNGTLPSDQQLVAGNAAVKLPSGAFDVLVPIGMRLTGTTVFGNPVSYGTAETPFFAGPECELVVAAIRNGRTNNAGVFITFTGYLEDVPPTQ